MKKPLRWVAVLFGLVVVALGVFVGLRHRWADRIFAESSRKVDALIAELRARTGERPTLVEPVSEQDAREIYESVLARIRAMSERDVLMPDWLEDPDSTFFDDEMPTEDEVEAWFVRTGVILDDLRLALSAPRVTAPADLYAGSDGALASVKEWQALSKIVGPHVTRCLERDEISEALDLSVMRAFVGEDVMRYGGVIEYLVGAGLVRESILELWPILEEHPVDPARLDRLATEAEVLRAGLPPLFESWRFDEINSRKMLGTYETTVQGNDATGDLAHLFTVRFMVAEALEGVTPSRLAFERAAAGRVGKAAREACWRTMEEIQEGGNVFLGMLVVIYPRTVEFAGATTMELDLLRLAVAIGRYRNAHDTWPARLGALVPNLLPAVPLCAYTQEPFRYEDGRVWSIGGDGDDDGGTPTEIDDHGFGPVYNVDADGDITWSIYAPPAGEE